MGYKAVWRKPDVSEELLPSRGSRKKPHKKPAEVGRNLILLFSCLDDSSTLKMEEICCSVTLVFLRTTRRHKPGELALRSHCREILRPKIYQRFGDDADASVNFIKQSQTREQFVSLFRILGLYEPDNIILVKTKFLLNSCLGNIS
jgi:hypothetical protein